MRKAKFIPFFFIYFRLTKEKKWYLRVLSVINWFINSSYKFRLPFPLLHNKNKLY
jgi:hypothetical protein